MSEQFKIEKVISTLPSVLSANTIYVVRVGNGYEMYVTDITGAIAHKLNDEKITKLKNRRLNFRNILGMEPFDLTEQYTSFSIQTMAEVVKYEPDFPEHLGLQNLRIAANRSYKLIFHYEYTKGVSNDSIRISLSDQDNGTEQLLEVIDLTNTSSGLYKYEIDFTANGDYQFVNLLMELSEQSESKVVVHSGGCYDKSLIKEDDLFDEELILPYNYFMFGFYALNGRIVGLKDEILEYNKNIRNSGVNLLYTEYTNPNMIYDYSNWKFDVPFTIEPALEYGINSWKFDISNTTAQSAVIFNAGGGGDDTLTPNLRLKRGKYLLSFYAKSSDAREHAIKFEFNTGIGIPYGTTEFVINSGVNMYNVLLDLPELNYAVKFYVNSQGSESQGKFLYIERMMLESVAWQDFDIGQGSYNPQPSSFSDATKNLSQIVAENMREARLNIGDLNSQINQLDDNKLDRSEYVQHFRGVYPSFQALKDALPTANDGDYAHIDSGQGFDRMGAIWDSSDNKWIVQSVNVGANTDEVPEGQTNMYFKPQRVLDTILGGLSTATNAVITSTDSVIGSFGKLQAQISNIVSTFAATVRSTVLSGLVFTNSNKVVDTDSMLAAIGKLQAQINGMSGSGSSSMVWVDASTLAGVIWGSNVDQSKTKLEYSRHNGMVWFKGYITTTSAVGSGGGAAFFQHKDPRFIVVQNWYTGFAMFTLAAFTFNTLQGSQSGWGSVGQSALSGDGHAMQSTQALAASIYYINPICLGVIKNP